MTTQPDAVSLRRDVGETNWYHTLELPHGIVTPGLFDLRDVVNRVLPNDLSGRRCLDACTASGFWAFQMEQRGAAEVVAIDIKSFRDQDWQRPEAAPLEPEMQRHSFDVAHRALGSSVKRKDLSVYDVTPESLGQFDFVFMGSVLLHLRDPVRALRALRTVTKGELRSFDVVLFWSSLLGPNTARGRFNVSDGARWWTPSDATHRRWVTAAGFDITESKRFIFQRQGALRREAARKVKGTMLRTRQMGWMLRKVGVPSQLLVGK